MGRMIPVDNHANMPYSDILLGETAKPMHERGPGMGANRACPAAGKDATKGHVLIVDDDAHMRTMLERVLGRCFPILTASAAEEAEELLGTHRVDVVVCDYRLPGEDGLSLTARWRRRDPSLQVVIQTGTAHHESLDRAAKDGMIFGYAIKPADIHALRKLVNEAGEHCRATAGPSR